MQSQFSPASFSSISRPSLFAQTGGLSNSSGQPVFESNPTESRSRVLRSKEMRFLDLQGNAHPSSQFQIVPQRRPILFCCGSRTFLCPDTYAMRIDEADVSSVDLYMKG